jgi:hypothetical protein
MRVMITRNQHYWHLGTGNLIHREVERPATDTVRVEQVTYNQEKVGAITIRNIDYSSECTAHAISEDIAPGTRTECVAFKVNVRRMYQLKLPRKATSHSHLPWVDAASGR